MEPCSILRIPRKCSHCSVVLCSLIPIYCSPGFPDHFWWLFIILYVVPKFFQLQGYIALKHRPLFIPPKHSGRLGGRGELQGRKAEPAFGNWLTVTTRFEWGSTLALPFTPPSQLSAAGTRVNSNESVCCPTSPHVSKAQTFFFLNHNQWGLNQEAYINLQELPTYAEWRQLLTLLKEGVSLLCDSTFPFQTCPEIYLTWQTKGLPKCFLPNTDTIFHWQMPLLHPPTTQRGTLLK